MNKLINLLRTTMCQSKARFTCMLLFALLLLPAAASAQKLTINGKILLAPDREEAIGASILVEGKTVGTVTGLDGTFTLDVPGPKGTLVVSYIGYQTVKVAYDRKKKDYTIVLKEDSKLLDEVVVMGYGELRKKEVTGAVARVGNEEISKMSTSDIGTAIQGMVAGVSVTAGSGEPGANSNIQIRGLSSITGSSQPLWVVDGVPYEGDPGLSSNEIESIDILKDAASAAIYGTRGAAGVILVTTKQGKEGQMKVSVDGYYGIQHITSGLDLVNTAGYTYLSILNNRRNGGVKDTDDLCWTSLLQYPVNFFNDSSLYNTITNNNAPIQNYSVTLNGGKKDLKYSLMANFFDQDGVIINSKYKRYNVRANSSFTRGKWNVNTILGFRIVDQQSPAFGLLTQSYTFLPTQSPIDPSQSTTTSAGQSSELQNTSNIMARVKEKSQKNSDNFNANFYVAYDIIKGMTISTRLGLDYTNTKDVNINPLFQMFDQDGKEVVSSNRSGIRNNHSRQTSLTWENMFNWNKKIQKHDFKFTGVFSIEQYKFNSFYASIKDLISNEFGSLNAGTADMTVGTGSGQWNQDRTTSLVGMLGRLQYNYADKYLFSASVRRDGSSRFSSQNRWGMFPSVSAGWNISEEPFFNDMKKVVNAMKLRASFGTTGNQNFEDYSYTVAIDKNYDYSFGAGTNGNLNLGNAQSAFTNGDVVWETTKSYNVGLDMSFLNSKFNLGLDLYQSDKNNMLFRMLVPPTNGAGSSSTVVLNAGNMRNRGIELTLGHKGNIGKMWYNVNYNVSRNLNEITKMAGATDMYYFDDGAPVNVGKTKDRVTAIKPGYEAGAFFVMPTNGIINTEQKLAEYQKLKSSARMGDLIYVDTNKDGLINDDDRIYGGSGQPECEMGLKINGGWNSFDISMNWYASLGNEIINASKIYTYQKMTNMDLIYQWSEVNPTSTIPSFGGTDHDNYRAYADCWVEDGSFLRLKNITVGYSFPKPFVQKLGFSKFRLYLAADNVLTVTKYDGYDPEVGNNGLSRRGLDYGTYPISSQFRGGFQVEF